MSTFEEAKVDRKADRGEKSRGARVISGAIAALFGIVFAIAMLEALLKVVDVAGRWADDRLASRISRVSEIPGVRYELVPNTLSKTPGQTIAIRVNNLGFRGADVTVEKPPGTYRIVVLGDSVSFARTLPENEAFPVLLETALGKGSQRIQVVNASLSGRDTWEHAALLQHRLVALAPDLVILQICLNDHVRFPFPDPDAPYGVFNETAWYEYSSLARFLDGRSRRFAEFRGRWLDRLGLASPAHPILGQPIDAAMMKNVDPHWDEWSRALLEIRDRSLAAGAQVLFVVFPMHRQVTGRESTTLPRLSAFAAEQGIPLVDLISHFTASRKRSFSDHIHPNRAGHRLVADALESEIRARFLGGP